MKRKVKISIFGALGLALSMSLYPEPSSAETLTPIIPSSSVKTVFESSTNKLTDNKPVPQASRYITHTVTFNSILVPARTYYYNAGGWKGTLNRTGYMQYRTTGITEGYYSGTISCSGTCSFSDEIK
ncbi:hypothetical protein [Bacillus mojavensis]|uniref:hypothetical protein n=1 Tax=Bacillus mojavensis TaxID=72360 RepID=UPI002DBDF0D3|nr:hypothetical protein [Bacillus mojavensis]MEC1751731.1 hypothetical protein [Bacillus mojavensis]